MTKRALVNAVCPIRALTKLNGRLIRRSNTRLRGRSTMHYVGVRRCTTLETLSRCRAKECDESRHNTIERLPVDEDVPCVSWWGAIEEKPRRPDGDRERQAKVSRRVGE
jgi:hypothetical protein